MRNEILTELGRIFSAFGKVHFGRGLQYKELPAVEIYLGDETVGFALEAGRQIEVNITIFTGIDAKQHTQLNDLVDKVYNCISENRYNSLWLINSFDIKIDLVDNFVIFVNFTLVCVSN